MTSQPLSKKCTVVKQGLAGTTVKVKLRWSDFTTLTRQTTLPQPIDADGAIFEAALGVFHAAWPEGKHVRLLGVGISGLDNAARQLSLWDREEAAQEQALQSALDDLRDRFGDAAVRRASDLEDQ